MLRQGSKPIVYLDHNWLSEITKAHIDDKRSVDRMYFRELANVLQESVASDRFAVPMSEFHESEGSLSSELDASLQSVTNILGHGLAFNAYSDISHEQLKEAAMSFAGLDVPHRSWWTIPFNRDPDTPATDSHFVAPPFEVYLRLDALIEEQRRLRNQVGALQYRKYKEGRRRLQNSYEDEIRFQRLQLLWEGYRGVSVAIQEPNVIAPGWEAINELVASQYEERWSEIARMLNQGRGPQLFLSSTEFLSVPFLDIRATLMGADIVRFANRSSEPSFQDDMSIVAMILPYADVFATENYIAELIRQTKLGKNYSCQVFTMRQRNEFLRYLEGL